MNICNFADNLYSENGDRQEMGIGSTNEEVNIFDDELKYELYEKCQAKATILMSENIRDNQCLMPAKKSLEIICKYLSKRIVELKFSEEVLEFKIEAGIEQSPLDVIGFKLNQLLYRIIIEIVRVLRFEFELYEEMADIELVIYFYEIIHNNLENLTKEDAQDLALKLMDIIIKIDDWRSRNEAKFKSNRIAELDDLSFEIVIKFIKSKCCF